MFTTFKEMEAYVLGQNLKKRIALANAHDEPALSAVVHAKRKGVVEGTLIGKKDMIIDMLHEMGENEADYEIVDFRRRGAASRQDRCQAGEGREGRHSHEGHSADLQLR